MFTKNTNIISKLLVAGAKSTIFEEISGSKSNNFNAIAFSLKGSVSISNLLP